MDLGGTVEFEFKGHYKLQRVVHQTTLGHLRIELSCTQRFLNPNLFDLLELKVLCEHLPEQLRDFWKNKMATSEEAKDIGEMTAEEVAQAMTVGDAPKSARIVAEIPKSPHTPRPKKDKQAMVQNPLRTKLTMEEMGKAVSLETDEEEEDLEDIMIEEEEDKDMEMVTEGAD